MDVVGQVEQVPAGARRVAPRSRRDRREPRGSERVLHLERGQGESLDAARRRRAVGDARAERTVHRRGLERAPRPAGRRAMGLRPDRGLRASGPGAPWRGAPSAPRSSVLPGEPVPHAGTRRCRAGRLPDGPAVDLYAGVGLFAISAAASGWDHVTAVEGDPISAADLAANASAFADRLRVTTHRSKRRSGPGGPGATPRVIVDPPRTGMSRAAVDGLLAARPRRVVYVSCDVATLARDARRLVDAGYGMGDVEAFDLFPNTAHVEVLTDFTRVNPGGRETPGSGPTDVTPAPRSGSRPRRPRGSAPRRATRTRPCARSSPGATARRRRTPTRAARWPRSLRPAPSRTRSANRPAA